MQVVLEVVGDAGAAVSVVDGEVGELGIALEVRERGTPVDINLLDEMSFPQSSSTAACQMSSGQLSLCH